MIKVGTHYGDALRGRDVSATVVRCGGVGGKRGQNFVPATRCIKFSSFKFVRHLGRDKMGSVFNVASCAPACLLYLRTVHVPPACTDERASSRVFVPASCLLMCADLKLRRACLFFFFFNEAKDCPFPKVKQRLTEQNSGFD